MKIIKRWYLEALIVIVTTVAVISPDRVSIIFLGILALLGWGCVNVLNSKMEEIGVELGKLHTVLNAIGADEEDQK